MIVCHCNGVGDREIRRAVRKGAGTLREVARACGAGTGCGSCGPALARIIARERGALAARRAQSSGEHAPAS